jgi:hypothetical protein
MCPSRPRSSLVPSIGDEDEPDSRILNAIFSGLFHFHRRDYAPAMSDTTFHAREDPWRIFRIMAEFVDSFQTFRRSAPP